MTEHSNVMGGSSVKKRVMCPGSYRLEAKMPPGQSSEYADRGSMLHGVMEVVLLTAPANMKEAMHEAKCWLDDDFGFDGHPFTEELLRTKIAPALDSWFRLRDRYGIHYDDVRIEVQLNLAAVIEGAFGTSDLIAIDAQNNMHILDWKFGDGVPVPVEGNWGCGFYGAAALYHDDEGFQEWLGNPDGVIFHIVQPREGYDDDPLQSWVTTVDWVEDLLDQCVAAADKAISDDPPLATGDWCRWCAAQPICPEQQKGMLEVIDKKPVGMTAVELGTLLTNLKKLETLKVEAFKFAQQQAEEGVQIPGWKLVNKRAMRHWNDTAEAEAACRKKRLKIDDMFDKKLKSPAQMEKLHPAFYSKTLSGMVSSISSGVTLVDESDKREAVTGSMQLLANALKTEN